MQKELDERERTIRLVNKDQFSCLLVGARQTGKRSVVKCFVKLLGEFKLAAMEYKREKMVAKLVECSERLQSISQQQQQQQQDDELAEAEEQQCASQPRSRLNSWLVGQPTVNRLIQQLPAAGRRRLQSVVGVNYTTSGAKRDRLELDEVGRRRSELPAGQQSPQLRLQLHTQNQQRRHTAIEPTCQVRITADPLSRPDGEQQHEDELAEGAHLGLRLPGEPAAPLNKSDSHINYSTDSSSIHSIQLHVPEALVAAQARARSAPNSPGRAYSRRPALSLKRLNRRRFRIRFRTRRYLSARCSEAGQLPDSVMVVYAINDRDSFDYASLLVSQLRALKVDSPLPIILVANKIDLERAKVIKSEEGRTLARRNACKYMEVSCTVGFNLDNLLVGLRTQLILKHHAALNTVFRFGKLVQLSQTGGAKAGEEANDEQQQQQQQQQQHQRGKLKGYDNILVRFYRRCLMDSHGQTYDCDNFSKL